MITPGDVSAAVVAEASGLSASAGQYFACSLRAFLRYCHVRGLAGADVSARISDLLVDIWEAALPLPAYEFAVVVQRAVAATGRIRSRQVWVPGHSDRPLRTVGAVVLRTAGVASTRSAGTLGPGTAGAGRRISLECQKHSG
ncbi:MAG TPA: hypothetical protein VFQ68_34610 [Streptosporangiaceae bacterium]|nr:hypothetical protein [Streptosporangiaceae bacterium]